MDSIDKASFLIFYADRTALKFKERCLKSRIYAKYSHQFCESKFFIIPICET